MTDDLFRKRQEAARRYHELNDKGDAEAAADAMAELKVIENAIVDATQTPRTQI